MDKPTQIIKVAGCLVKNGKILMIREKEAKIHNLPQGIVEFGESPDEAVMRSFLDETGLIVEAIAPFRIYSFTEDNVQTIVIHYLVALVDEDDDEIIVDDETKELNWLDAKEVGEERQSWDDEIRQSVEIAIDLESEKENDWVN